MPPVVGGLGVGCISVGGLGVGPPVVGGLGVGMGGDTGWFKRKRVSSVGCIDNNFFRSESVSGGLTICPVFTGGIGIVFSPFQSLHSIRNSLKVKDYFHTL